MKKKMLMMLLCLFAPGLLLAQEVQVGVKTSQNLNSQRLSYGVTIMSRSASTHYTKFTMELGEDFQKALVGIGYTHEEIAPLINFSVGAALGYINFSPEFDLTEEDRRNQFTALFQNELEIMLSRRLSVGINLDLDVINWARVGDKKDEFAHAPGYKTAKDLRTKLGNDCRGGRCDWYEGMDEQGRTYFILDNDSDRPLYPRYNTRSDYEDALNAVIKRERKRSMSGTGVTIRYRF